MKIEITMERTIRIARTFDATEEQIKGLRYGDNPFSAAFEEDFETEWKNKEFWDDYAVNDEDGNTIVDWS
jgi:hypothetical protein